MGLDVSTVIAIFRKDMRQYLANPTGYVFVTLFIATTATFAFVRGDFFSRNLADLAELNAVMPIILLFFVPAITMSAWADERRAGTDELLLTMPVRDIEVVLGKYLGVLGMYTVSLGFSLANVVVLEYLGDPDVGLMFSTYLGYWLMGALFCAIGLVASMLTTNLAVAFILGALGCAGLVVAGTAPWASGLVGATILCGLGALAGYAATAQRAMASVGALVGGGVGVFWWLFLPAATAAESETAKEVSHNPFVAMFEPLSVADHFSSFGEGVIRMGDAVYFIGGIAVLLYLCSFLLGRRHW